ncbi:hypothetical protein K1T71_014503 [Dendrolimus kikuchii]|uniref:Uncharacterized protein n=1 Tax=Dendrolimus kikuchii TaxID=765133 RepID=A0ACC1CEM0_9NEOP|nr:hypothetical protein K1T71_014503 [Dendrolimus kikuchii]
MSAVADDRPLHIECNDGERKPNENHLSAEGTCDSGMDTTDSYLNMVMVSDSEISPLVNHDKIQVELDQTCATFLENGNSRAGSISPEELANKLNFDNYSPENYKAKEQVTNLPITSSNSDNLVNNSPDNFKNDSINLRTSTVSLDDHKSLTNNTNVICRSPYSKSAENLTLIEQNDRDDTQNTFKKELNTEEILSEYNSHKNKVTAVQKIPETTVDIRYTRIPKDILSQDIGSIVKNVHGIFSSVSGSLKNAYTHRTVQKPIKVTKAVNGKVMNDIFEDNDLKTEEDPITSITDTKSSQESLLESNSKKDVLKLQVESLEKILTEQRKENASLRERVKQYVDEVQEKDQTFKELECKLDVMSKRVEQAEREKDAAVMRYASVECAKIEAKRAAEASAKAEKAALAEMELLNNKLKSAHAEKQRICQLYDDKCHELMNNERDLAKVREDMRELEGRLKWTQSKLRMEMDAYKESAERAEKLSQQVSELEAAKEVAATNATDTLRAKQLEAELKECRAALILCRHEKEELEKRYTSTSQQLDVTTKERDAAKDALATATLQVSQLTENNARLEEEAAELAALRAQAALADTLSAQLQRETERAMQAEEALSVERALAETCGRREAAALEHAARLTAQHVAHRASTQHHEAKAHALAVDNASLRERIQALESESAHLRSALTNETDKRNKENRVLARKRPNKKLEWEKVKLNRKLQRAIEKQKARGHNNLTGPHSEAFTDVVEVGMPHKLSSITSLSSGEGAAQEDRLQNGHSDNLPDIQVREPDRQALIERIVSLQRAAARRAERCEFLEEHARQLTGELRAKSRLLRSLLCDLPAGAVTSRNMDQNKKEIAKLGGGAMAAVWGGDPNGMTLELSLEMNKRLQAVLEDTLLKNITLKENIDTLGAEISRLKEQKNASNDSK